MAEKLASFDFASRSVYPWGEWTDGSIWKVKKGEDFCSTIPAFRSILSQRAAQEDMKVRASAVDESTMVFQFFPKDDS